MCPAAEFPVMTACKTWRCLGNPGSSREGECEVFCTYSLPIFFLFFNKLWIINSFCGYKIMCLEKKLLFNTCKKPLQVSLGHSLRVRLGDPGPFQLRIFCPLSRVQPQKSFLRLGLSVGMPWSSWLVSGMVPLEFFFLCWWRRTEIRTGRLCLAVVFLPIQRKKGNTQMCFFSVKHPKVRGLPCPCSAQWFRELEF